MQEREQSAELFKGKKGQQFARDIGKRVKTFIPGAPVGGEQVKASATPSAAPATTAAAKQNIEAIKVWDVNGFSR